MKKNFSLFILTMALFTISSTSAISNPVQAPATPVAPATDEKNAETPNQQDQNTVMVSVNAKTINKGEIMPPTAIQVDEQSTAWSVLQKALDEKKIKYELKQNKDDFYVVSINGISTESAEKGSGWMYSVNGIYGKVCANLCKVKKGDKVEWHYTTNLGKDLGVSE
ncbi:hypothetical protein AN640_08490 [Candidatus Epulonipiscium fishelsonii]|uniref:Uncharacterized protein n=1 Tax=Candidatus Epulonipiscium fishelsonii TaxID=77094 RepID=A0ACC8XD12_9FIRM|nr:hypothetical protein AN640_08490 [Epulopiscium sp. SCG-D08WGA-EpuloA1]